MRTRKCEAGELNTGKSACQVDFNKIKGAIVVPDGKKLPANFDADSLEEMCHADWPDRIMPIFPFVEYAKDGGEVQTSAVGYGPNQATGVSARTDTFTYEKYNEHLASALMKSLNTKYGVYFFDEENYLYGIDDGTDVLAPIPMSTIYPNATPHPTSSASALLEIKFAYVDARKAIENFNYEKVDFDISQALIGLIPVKLVKGSGNSYQIVEAVGGLNRTAEFGTIIATNAADVLNNVTAATYADDALTLTVTEGSTPSLKAPSLLYAKGIKGVVGV